MMKLDRQLDTAIAAAKEAGRIQMERLGHVRDIQFKGEINLVTEVDKLCEETIFKILKGPFPQYGTLGEESGGQKGDSDFKWIVDPLDGTTNYAHSYPLFCVSIALEYKGEIVCGVVYEPNLAELFVAEKGSGATLNGRRLAVSKIDRLKRALLATGFAYNVQQTEIDNLSHFGDFIKTAQAVRRDGVAATDLCYVAAGRFDGFWEIGLFPWDIAAGALIVKEAGGQVTAFDGSTVDTYGKEILASNGLIHEAMIDVLKAKQS